MTPEEVPQNTVAGQYGPARIGGEDVPGFRQEQGVDPELADRHLCRGARSSSTTGDGRACRSTCARGKRLPKRVTEIAIQFNAAPLAIFKDGDRPTAARRIC